VRLGERFKVSGDVQSFLGELESYYRRELGPAAAAPAPLQPAPAPADWIAG
jgi:hypothetical protein